MTVQMLDTHMAMALGEYIRAPNRSDGHNCGAGMDGLCLRRANSDTLVSPSHLRPQTHWVAPHSSSGGGQSMTRRCACEGVAATASGPRPMSASCARALGRHPSAR